jgi:hypothetical protein
MAETTLRTKWEPLVIIAWVPLTAAWLWPIISVVIKLSSPDSEGRLFGRDSYQVWSFYFGMANLDWIAIPGFALMALVCVVIARRRIRQDGLRGESIAKVTRIVSLVTLLGSPVLIPVFWVMAVGLPMV